MSHVTQFLAEAKEIIDGLDTEAIERMVSLVEQTRVQGGRLFILGVGGSAANASHAVNDFRKIVGIEAYAPTDNVSELTARTNDEGWSTTFTAWLRISRLKQEDLILVLSVGGGNLEKNVSPNLVTALKYAREVGTPVIGIVGKDGGYTTKVAAACAIVPTVNPDHVTPHSEAFQAVIWHLLVSHPRLKAQATKWESVSAARSHAKRAVFLDRDGVLNRAVIRDGRPYPPPGLDAFEILPGVPEAVRRLHEAGFLLIGATNQPDVARGTQHREVVEAMNSRLLAAMPISAILASYDDGDDCARRKPNPGLLLEAAETFEINLSASFMVGDRWRDVEAGRRAGCRTIFIDRGYSERRPDPDADYVAADLEEAAAWILSQTYKP
jgi:D-sedoheptulose 7-phosphate isomerase